MSFRTTSSAVCELLPDKELLPRDSAGAYDVTPQIMVANEITTEYCVSSSSTYSEGRLTLIETWLAAHYVTLSLQQQAVSESAGDVSRSLAQPSQKGVSSGFAATRYGRTAIALDTAGELLRASLREEKGWLRRRTIGLYGGSATQGTYLNPTANQPGFYPG